MSKQAYLIIDDYNRYILTYEQAIAELLQLLDPMAAREAIAIYGN